MNVTTTANYDAKGSDNNENSRTTKADLLREASKKGFFLTTNKSGRRLVGFVSERNGVKREVDDQKGQGKQGLGVETPFSKRPGLLTTYLSRDCRCKKDLNTRN